MWLGLVGIISPWEGDERLAFIVIEQASSNWWPTACTTFGAAFDKIYVRQETNNKLLD
jgi:hypothetical protein